MGVLVYVVAADEDEIGAVGTALKPLEDWSGIQARDLDTLKFVSLHCLLSEDTYQDAIGLYEPVFLSGDEDTLVLRIPDRITAKLAGLDKEGVRAVGEELAASEEFERANRGVPETVLLLAQLADLARLADSQEQVLFVRMHLLEE